MKTSLTHFSPNDRMIVMIVRRECQMGWISDWKNKINQKEQNQARWTHSPIGYNLDLPNGTDYEMRPWERKMGFTHGNGRVTDLMISKVQKYQRQDAHMLDRGDPVIFEVPSNITTEQFMEAGILQLWYEQGLLDHLKDNQYNNLGEVIIENGQLKVQPMSSTVLQYVQQIDEEYQIQRAQEIEEYKRQNEQYMRQQRQREEESLRRQMQEEQIRAIQNRQHPVFYACESADQTKEATEYRGTNLETGQQIHLQCVKKLGIDEKTPNGVYLYEAALSLENEQMGGANIKPEEALPILFTTSVKLSDIANGVKPQELQNILSLLSVIPNDYPYMEKNFIGQLKNGEISRDLKQTSAVIQQTVKRLQTEYKNKQQKGWER